LAIVLKRKYHEDRFQVSDLRSQEGQLRFS
jgi:hypothetical protein